MKDADSKPSCGIALLAAVGIPILLLLLANGLYRSFRPQQSEQQETQAISSPVDGNRGTICAAAWFRMALEDVRTHTEQAQSESDTAQAFIDLGNGDRGRAIKLSRLLDRPIIDRGCLIEFGGDNLNAAEAAVRARRNAAATTSSAR
jgi:hypothetical protein